MNEPTELPTLNHDVYVVICDDRHTDPDATVFATEETARTFAQCLALEWSSSPADVKVIEERIEDRLLSIEYSCEGDALWVVRRTVR